jgi:hypothetical protein
MVATGATQMPDGMVVLLPSLLDATRFGPQTAVTATAIHTASTEWTDTTQAYED